MMKSTENDRNDTKQNEFWLGVLGNLLRVAPGDCDSLTDDVRIGMPLLLLRGLLRLLRLADSRDLHESRKRTGAL